MIKRVQRAIVERRMTLLFFFFLILFGILVTRLFLLQIVGHREYAVLAARQHRVRTEITPERGTMYVRDKTGARIPVATVRAFTNVAVSPREVADPDTVVSILADALGIDTEPLAAALARTDDPYEVIARKVSGTAADRISLQNLKGVYLEEEVRRWYPYDSLAAHAVGYAGVEYGKEQGRYGIERYYEHELTGDIGFLEGLKDATGFLLGLGRRIVRPPKDGHDLLLTIDLHIQEQAEKVLQRVAEKWGAKSGSLLVVEPSSGRILALAASPTFNPNDFSSVGDIGVFLNPVVQTMFEPGSVLKPITMAGALDKGLLNAATTYTDAGLVKIGAYTIKNFDGKAYGVQTMAQVLEKSLNTGMVHVARMLGQEGQRSYFERFGFGERTGIDLPGEVPGNIANLSTGREVDLATVSFGQGVAVSPLQVAMAIAAIGNKGTLMRPYIVEEVIDDSGNSVPITPERVRQAISPETAETLTKMLVAAVRNGFENRAGVNGYFVAGKTGTAQIPREDRRGYLDDRFIHTFAGYAPAFDPKFLVYLQLNEPKGNRFASNTLTPAFHDLAEFILNYYGVPPDEQ